ncbi:MAG: hydrogenase formation protein HypD [Bacteroidetes bacterium]|nr:MAG: hydrogenase formation protein HypD [Bacteroidota bacterium]
MKYIDEYRDKQLVEILIRQIRDEVTRKWTIMEICGGQTHAIMKYSLQDLLPEEISLIHGPGCPVCVTPVEIIDQAVELGGKPNVILTSFGDMMRVPGSHTDLLSVRAKGGDIRIVYSPLDVIDIALSNPEREVVFFAVGFETTAPAVALAIRQAHKKNLANFSVLISHVLVPPAIEVLLTSADMRIEGFLAAGHVCTVMGTHEYIPLSERYKIPIVVTGFEPVDILLGIQKTINMLENDRYGVENAYPRSVKPEGNIAAQDLLQEVFVSCDRKWRGIGVIPGSGFTLTDDYIRFDAGKRFKLHHIVAEESERCISGKILTGQKRPSDCPAFGAECTPEKPLGAPMVSSEGACSAYYRYHLRMC